jgi:hypothetical protein
MERAWARWDWHAGRAVGWAQGYRAGFHVGGDIGGAGVLLTIQTALPDGVLPDLLPRLPYTGEYRRLQRLREHTTDPCRRACGACSGCIHAAAGVRNLARYGSVDYPGGPVPWAYPVPADDRDVCAARARVRP